VNYFAMNEISKEENDLRLFLITIYNGLCPICKKNIINITDWEYGIEFNTQKRAYFCHKCGYVATEKHIWY
jgi:C4-type Zn-finger protein